MFPSGEQNYHRKKQRIVETFLKGLEEKRSFALNKTTSNLFRNRKSGPSQKLDVKQLNQVISIDPVRQMAVVEGMITYDDFVKEALKYQTLPAVVPQLKTITVGGAIAGLGIESTSFRYGLVHETVLEMEILTGNGEVVLCTTENEHRDLFYAFPNSYGTLGYALKVTLKLIPAKKFVRLTNLHFANADLYFQKFEELCRERRSAPFDSFIDGVIFNENKMAIVLGEFVEEVPYVNDYTYLHAYYKSIQTEKANYLTVYDYIWRWDADWFWCSKHFGMNNPFLRLLFGKFMLHSAIYWQIKRLIATNRFVGWLAKLFEKPTESVIQDILIPIQNAGAFYEFFRQAILITPVWICPFQFYRTDERYTLCRQLDPTVLYLDFGFWDMIPSTQPPGFYNRLIERKSEELDGFKSFYSDSYYSEEEFWNIYSKSAIAALKKRYDPHGAFKDLYDKCVRKG